MIIIIIYSVLTVNDFEIAIYLITNNGKLQPIHVYLQIKNIVCCVCIWKIRLGGYGYCLSRDSDADRLTILINFNSTIVLNIVLGCIHMHGDNEKTLPKHEKN